jgi:hypothetical protein
MNVSQICLRRQRLVLASRRIAEHLALAVSKCDEQAWPEFALLCRTQLSTLKNKP